MSSTFCTREDLTACGPIISEDSVRAIGALIFREDQLKDQLTAQDSAIKTQNAQIAKHKKEVVGFLPKNKETHAKTLLELEGEYTRSEAKVEGLRLQRKHLHDLVADVRQTTQLREPNRFQNLKTRFAGAGLSAAAWETFRMVFKGDGEDVVTRAVKEVEAKIKKATEIDPKNPLDSSKVALSALPIDRRKDLLPLCCRERSLSLPYSNGVVIIIGEKSISRTSVQQFLADLLALLELTFTGE